MTSSRSPPPNASPPTDLATRDQGICRTPWCDAPVRHLDHIRPHENDGLTEAENLQGLCQACNHAKQATGWRQHVVSDPDHWSDRHTVETTSPTGHTYLSRAPAPPGAASTPGAPPRIDLGFYELTLEDYSRAS